MEERPCTGLGAITSDFWTKLKYLPAIEAVDIG